MESSQKTLSFASISGRKIEELPLYNGLLNQGSLIDHLPKEGLLILDRMGEIESDAGALADRAEELRATREARGELPANFPSPQLSWNEVDFEASGIILKVTPEELAEARRYAEGPPSWSRTSFAAGPVRRLKLDINRLAQTGIW